jgi:hypothetical protein
MFTIVEVDRCGESSALLRESFHQAHRLLLDDERCEAVFAKPLQSLGLTTKRSEYQACFRAVVAEIPFKIVECDPHCDRIVMARQVDGTVHINARFISVLPSNKSEYKRLLLTLMVSLLKLIFEFGVIDLMNKQYIQSTTTVGLVLSHFRGTFGSTWEFSFFEGAELVSTSFGMQPLQLLKWADPMDITLVPIPDEDIDSILNLIFK